MAVQPIEAVHPPFDHKTFLPMVGVLKDLPDDADLKTLPHPDIRATLESRDMMFGARHPLGVIVALAGATIEDDGQTVHLTEIAANSRASEETRVALMDTFVDAARSSGAEAVVLDVTPEPGTTAAAFAERYGVKPDTHGAFVLRLVDQ